jgi:hypothetical protein
MWARNAEGMSAAQSDKLQKELRALISRSIAYTLASAELIDKTEAAAITATFDTQEDPSCHPMF